MRSITLLLFALLLAPAALAQERQAFDDVLPFAPGGHLAIDTYKGTIHVEAWDREGADVDVRIEADEDPELVDRVQVRVDTEGDRLRIEVDYEDANRRWGNTSLPFAHVRVRVPRQTTLALDDYKSEIRIVGLEGDHVIETYKGPLELADLTGDIELETYKSEFEATGLRGGLVLDTYKGTGTVHFAALTDDVEVETYKGDVELVLPTTGFDLDADLNDRADLRADFDLDRLRRGDRDDNDFRGSVHGGGPVVELESYKGEIRLRTGAGS